MKMDKIEQLIYAAKRKMKKSRDPIHDINHARRVAGFARRICKDMDLTTKQRQAIILAAWWHDMGRTITKNPSVVWMPFIDDLISACMLWWATLRCGLFGTVAGLSTRVIFCKGIGTGAILTRLLLRKKNRILVDIVKDADALDVLSEERAIHIMKLVDSSKLYKLGYKLTFWWFGSSMELHLKTTEARKYFEQILKNFISWFKQKHIFDWHTIKYGQNWTKKIVKQSEMFLQNVIKVNIQNASL